MSEQTWLQSLKVGDEVAVRLPHAWREQGEVKPFEIRRATAAYIDCGSVSFRRKDGRQVGFKDNHSCRYHQLLGLFGEYVRNREMGMLRERLWEAALHSRDELSIDQLRRIVAILDESRE